MMSHLRKESSSYLWSSSSTFSLDITTSDPGGCKKGDDDGDVDGDGSTTAELQSSKSSKHQVNMVGAAVLAATLSSFSLGTVLTWSGVVLADPSFRETFPEIGDGSWVASLQLLGAFCSAPASGWFISKVGRRRKILLFMVLLVLGWGLVAFAAPSVAALYLGRFLTGFFAGAFTVSVPVYMSEICDDRTRGLASIHSAMVNAGVLFTYLMGAFANWYVLTLVCGAIPLVSLLVMYLIMPESPRYLLLKGKEEEARAALQWLRKGSSSSSSSEIEEEIYLLRKSIINIDSHAGNLSLKLVFSRRFFQPVGICVLLFVMAKFSGFTVLRLYTVKIFRDSGTNLDEYLASIIFGFVQLLTGAAVPLLLVERVGRRGLLVASGVTMGCCFLLLGLLFHVKETTINNARGGDSLPECVGWLSVAALMMTTVGYCVGFGPVPWVLTSEILPPDVKEFASSAVSMSYWTFSFLSGKTFPRLQAAVGYMGVYWLSSGICLAGAVFVYLCVPETKGRSSEEIQGFFSNPTEPKIKTHQLSDEEDNMGMKGCGGIKIQFVGGDGCGLDNPGFDKCCYE